MRTHARRHRRGGIEARSLDLGLVEVEELREVAGEQL